MDPFDAHVHPLGAFVSAPCASKKIICGGARLHTLSADAPEDPTVTDAVSSPLCHAIGKALGNFKVIVCVCPLLAPGTGIVCRVL